MSKNAFGGNGSACLASLAASLRPASDAPQDTIRDLGRSKAKLCFLPAPARSTHCLDFKVRPGTCRLIVTGIGDQSTAEVRL